MSGTVPDVLLFCVIIRDSVPESLCVMTDGELIEMDFCRLEAMAGVEIMMICWLAAEFESGQIICDDIAFEWIERLPNCG